MFLNSLLGTSKNWFVIGKFDLIKQEQARKLANIGDIRQFEQQTIAQNQGGFVRE